MKFVFIADFFANQVPGGGEINNEELISLLIKDNIIVERINSNLVTPKFIGDNKQAKFIVANFSLLSDDSIRSLYDKEYIIYEHDHKYVEGRNPGIYKDFIVPQDKLVNIAFYEKAKAVLCQTDFHLEIVKKNTKLNNLISLGGNLWSDDILEHMRDISLLPKRNTYAVMNSRIEHKNTADAITYCQIKNIPHVLVANPNYKQFLSDLGINIGLVFFPKTPETLSRIVAEARMMGLSIKTNNLVGATKENWFGMKGSELIDFMKNKKLDIKNIVLDSLL